MRRTLILTAIGFCGGLGCALLEPYPGGEDPAQILGNVTTSDGGPPLEMAPGGGATLAQDPLINPAIDPTINALSKKDFIIAHPGESFIIDLSFLAQNGNVVGGGIQFPGSDRVQWTLIDGIEGRNEGDLQFAYVVPEDVCDDVPNLCHEIATKQFAVGRNVTGGDVDGDGEPDGDFVVSAPADVPVILKCASCESPSCQDLLPGLSDPERPWTCSACQQPFACAETERLCFADGRPKEGTDEAVQFELVFGPEGVTWTSSAGCALAEPSSGFGVCDAAYQNALEECVEEGEDVETI